MAKEVRADIETMRAADADRQKVADQLKTALDEGRLTLHEYDERVALAYSSKTYQELLMLLTDLPRPGLSASEVRARHEAEQRRAARRLPTAMLVLWTIWASLTVVNLVVYALVALGADDVYPWPVWMLVPGAALAAVTVGVQVIRHQQR
ncbi:DUF1707 SHOCT-like domain-containing protein [Paractinoplanes brasiliensis]|uniref:Uncharacterized protein DUF1707 n=1 Tax=Paractinoplanes brasiliensis TaxID=52695 RepID=A0A4R6JVW7_9ACTN|nr:DUF1707 domain-containing protein [Actinoplanes brasiliensis]TDO38835.1 uncharacterized protein DUF1707 [Actinoplanes brasiliensis]GID26387.1 hypothetical protein Abr02nite_13700 [Actinoplanes brasiliensis]